MAIKIYTSYAQGKKSFHGLADDKMVFLRTKAKSASYVLTVQAAEPQDDVSITINNENRVSGISYVNMQETEFEAEVKNPHEGLGG